MSAYLHDPPPKAPKETTCNKRSSYGDGLLKHCWHEVQIDHGPFAKTYPPVDDRTEFVCCWCNETKGDR